MDGSRLNTRLKGLVLLPFSRTALRVQVLKTKLKMLFGKNYRENSEFYHDYEPFTPYNTIEYTANDVKFHSIQDVS